MSNHTVLCTPVHQYNKRRNRGREKGRERKREREERGREIEREREREKGREKETFLFIHHHLNLIRTYKKDTLTKPI